MPKPDQPYPKVRCRQILDSDVSGVADILARGFPRRSISYWLRALDRLSRHSVPSGLPRYGYLLDNDGTPVGVLLLIFSTVRTGDALTIRCNVSSWYVEPAFRAHAPLLTLQALKTKNITYLNISSQTHVLPVIEVQGFSRYSSGQFVAIPSLSGNAAGGKVTSSGPH